MASDILSKMLAHLASSSMTDLLLKLIKTCRGDPQYSRVTFSLLGSCIFLKLICYILSVA
jgi:hypothetical protein